MKHSLTALAALAAVVALPALAFASPNLDFTVAPPGASPSQTLASAQPLIYPDIPAKVTRDDHLAVVTPLATAVPTPRDTALIVPRNGDPSEALASAEGTYLASECPSVMAHPGDHTALLDRFCQDKRS